MYLKLVSCGKCRTKLLKVKQQGTFAISEADGNILIERSDRDIDMENNLKTECVSLTALQAR